jgi:integrase
MAKRAIGVYLRTGTNVYQWRIRVPKDLAGFYPGKEWAERRSLGTSNLPQANMVAAQLYADWLTAFDKQRKQLAPESVHCLTPELIKFLSETLRHNALTADHNNRTKGEWAKDGGLHGMPDWLQEQISEDNVEEYVRLTHANKTGDISEAFPELEHVARQQGLTVTEKTPGIEESLRSALAALREAAIARLERDKGHTVPTPPPPGLKPEKVDNLRDIFDLWKKAEGLRLTPDTVRARERALELFEEFTGNTPITKVSRMQGNGFKAWLQTRGEASKTVSDRLTYVKSLFNYAYRDLEVIPRHPWAGLTIDYETETFRKPWTADQIGAFFAQPLYVSYALPLLQKGAGADAGYWIPLLGLFSGARSSELCQLYSADILKVEDVWVIDINEHDPGKTVKTKASRRQVPIHSELIRLGFIDYVTTIRAGGNERLWPKLALRQGRPSHTFSRWFGEARRLADTDIVIPDFHSLRHTVRHTMTAAHVVSQHQDAITGHEIKGSTGDTVYAKHVTMAQKQAAVEAIRYEGFNLPRSYKVI